MPGKFEIGDSVYRLRSTTKGKLYKKPRLLTETLPISYARAVWPPVVTSLDKIYGGKVEKLDIYEGELMYRVRFPTTEEAQILGAPSTTTGWYPEEALVTQETAKKLIKKARG